MSDSRSHLSRQTLWLVSIDILCLIVGSMLGVIFRMGVDGLGEYVYDHVDGWLVFFFGIVLANYLAGAYRLQNAFSRFNLVVTWIFSLSFALVVLSITSYAWFSILLGRGVLMLSVLSYGALSLSMKLLLYRILFRSKMFLCRTAIIGVGSRAREMRHLLESSFVLPTHKVVAFVDQSKAQTELASSKEFIDGVAVVRAPVEELEHLSHLLGIELLVLGLDDRTQEHELYPHLKRLRFGGIEVMMPLAVAEIYGGRTPLDLVDESSLMRFSMESGLPIVRRVKRLADILMVLVGAIVALPAGLAIGIAIKLSEFKYPVFYHQRRIGQFGKEFSIIKFRTMQHGAETETGAVWAQDDDTRVTPIGKFLRRYRLDEIPQMINVLRGDMSVVGPRPERPELAEYLDQKIPFFNERCNVMPGLTGWAQVRYPYGSSVKDAARKLEYDIYYIKHLSLSLDLQIVLSTLRIVMYGKERSM